jgi:hypothetical protein
MSTPISAAAGRGAQAVFGGAHRLHFAPQRRAAQ